MLRILSAFVLKAAGPVPAGFSVFLWPTFAVYRPSRPRDFLSDLPGALVPVVESAVPYLESRYLRYLSRRQRLHDPSDPLGRTWLPRETDALAYAACVCAMTSPRTQDVLRITKRGRE